MAITEHQVPVLVVGAGPAGLIAALQLAKNGTKCMLVERNLDTTKWPKMDITNARSMELLKRLGIDQGLRDVGVPQNYSFDVLFSSGLSNYGRLIAKWDLPSPNEWRTIIRQQNDGSMPREPYQRCSQAVFEAWLKPRIQNEPLIETHFGWKLLDLVETSSEVESHLVDVAGNHHLVKSQYVIGCDGAGSKVRATIGSTLEGGPVPGATYLIHFKSKELSQLHVQGQFWHIFFTTGCVIISQDEIDTWTVHCPIPIDTDTSKFDPVEWIHKALGGENAPHKIKVDEILVTSVWRPNLYLADNYSSEGGRVFISGDAAHQNIPTGGYGMNTAVGDSFDIGWKIAAVLAGHAGSYLLKSYEFERRPVAATNIRRSGEHFSIHGKIWSWCSQNFGVASSDGPEGEALRDKIVRHITSCDGENRDHGIELGYRYTGSPVVINEQAEEEPPWSTRHYIPSTWPGARAPHVFLTDGKTSIFDLFGSGNQYTLIDFTKEGSFASVFEKSASEHSMPLKTVCLSGERHARTLWQRDAVLVRPDDHVAWRCSKDSALEALDVDRVLSVVLGKRRLQKKPDNVSKILPDPCQGI